MSVDVIAFAERVRIAVEAAEKRGYELATKRCRENFIHWLRERARTDIGCDYDDTAILYALAEYLDNGG